MKKKILFVFFAMLALFGADLWAEPRLVAQNRHGYLVNALKYSADGKYLFSASNIDAMVWDVATGKMIRSYAIKTWSGCDMAPDGKSVVYVSTDGIFKRSFVETGKEVNVFSGKIQDFCKVCYASNGKYYAIQNAKDAFKIYDAATDKVLYEWTNKGWMNTYGFAFGCDPNSGLTYFIRGEEDSILKIRNVIVYNLSGKDAGKIVYYKKLPLLTGIYGLAVSPGNKYIAI